MKLLAESLKYHHIGVAVDSIEISLKLYQELGYHCSDPVYDSLQNVYLAFCDQKESQVELVAPYDENSPCKTYLNKNGPGPYHICYEVESIQATKYLLKQNKFQLKELSPTQDTVLFQNARVNFCYIHNMGLVEFIEYKKI